jgi:hypothetical protein
MNIKIPTVKIPKILVTIAVIMIYFQIYWHYWFVKLLGGYVVNTLLPIMLLFSVFIIRGFVSHDTGGIKKRKIFYLLILLFYYLLFASASIFLNEEGFENIKRFLIYIYSPVLIFVSILGLYVYRKNENIKFTLNVLFILSLILSIYVAITYSVDPLSVSRSPVLETNRGEKAADTGGSYGVGDLSAIRYTIPGISSTTYGPLLVPLIFVGLYFRKNTVGKLKHLYLCAVLFLTFCVFMTVSRGPIVILIAGLIYFIWQKWLRLKEVMFTTVIFIILNVTFAKLSLLRVVNTFVTFIPIDLTFLGKDVAPLLEDPRVMSVGETLSYIYQNLFWGSGMTILSLVYDKEHNNYLSVAASFGVPTFILYLLFVFLLFIMIHENIKKISKDSSSKDLGIVLSAGLLSLIVYLNFASAEFHFIWIWFGLAAAWLRNCEDEFLLRKPAIHKLCSEKI